MSRFSFFNINTATFLLLAFMGLPSLTAFARTKLPVAQDYSDLVGQRVLTRELGAKFVKDGNEVLAQPGKLYVVDRTEANKIWVRGQSGWIDGSSIIDATAATKFFTTRLYEHPTLENYLSRAQAWAAKGQLDRALTDYEAAIHLDSDSGIAHNGRGNCLIQQQDYQGAIQSYSHAIKAKPDYAAAHNNLGNAWRAIQEYEKALANYDAAIKIRPGVAQAIFGQGVCYSALARHDEAIKSFDEVVSLRPDHADAYNERGLAWQRKGDFLKAIASFTASTNADPDHFEALNNLAWLLANCKQKELRSSKRAVEVATRACKATEYKSWYCLGTLAASYARNRRFDAAVKAQKMALRMMPTGITTADRNDYEKRLKIYYAGMKAS